jgi:type IV pilus assembly protein PilQ
MRAAQGGDGGYQIGNTSNRIVMGNSYSDAVAASGAGGSVSTSGSFVNLPATTPIGGVGVPATFAISIFNNLSNRFLNLEISALEADDKGRVVSSPRVVTADGKKALIKQGDQIPYQTCDKNGSCTTTFKDANLRLEVTPQITPEGAVIMDLDVSKDTKGVDTAAGPVISGKNVTTQVLVENGGTVVIGGIFEQTESTNETGVPWLRGLPVLGNLFQTKSRTDKKTELLVFVTPRIITEKTGTR